MVDKYGRPLTGPGGGTTTGFVDDYVQQAGNVVGPSVNEGIAGGKTGAFTTDALGTATELGQSIANALEALFQGLFGAGLGASQGIGGTGSMDLGTILSNAFPDSIPITNKVSLETQNIVYIDGTKVMEALNKRLWNDIQTAKRSAGVVGFQVS